MSLLLLSLATPPSHCLFISHGSRDSRYALAQQDFLADVQLLLPQSQLFSGVLELNDRSLHEQIITIVETHQCQSLTLLPLFLQPGTHVLQDLPEEFQKAQDYLHGHRLPCQLRPLTYLGAIPRLQTFLKSCCSTSSPSILIAHGSTHPQAQAFFTRLHQTLGTHPAYWQHPPSLSEAVHILLQQGNTSIGFLPYFLFPGKITDAIVQELQSLKDQYKHVDFSDRFPLLCQQPHFASLIAHLLCTITETTER